MLLDNTFSLACAPSPWAGNPATAKLAHGPWPLKVVARHTLSGSARRRHCKDFRAVRLEAREKGWLIDEGDSPAAVPAQ